MTRAARVVGVVAIAIAGVAGVAIALSGLTAVRVYERLEKELPARASARTAPGANGDRPAVVASGATDVGASSAAPSSRSAKSDFEAMALAAPSLAGTSVDGAFETDAAGRFVPSAKAVRLFDYFLSAQGEIPARSLRADVGVEAERALAPREADRAVALFDRYVAYRPRAAAALADVAPGDRPGALAALHRARQDAFGADDATRMFGEAETIAGVAIREADIAAAGLPDAERAKAMAEQESALPAWLREIHERRARDSEALAALEAR